MTNLLRVNCKIKLLFCIRRKSGWNESNRFLSLRKYYKQYIDNFPYRNLSILINAMPTIKHPNVIGIIKNRCCRFKWNFVFFLHYNIFSLSHSNFILTVPFRLFYVNTIPLSNESINYIILNFLSAIAFQVLDRRNVQNPARHSFFLHEIGQLSFGH